MNENKAFEAFQFLIELYTEEKIECETNVERKKKWWKSSHMKSSKTYWFTCLEALESYLCSVFPGLLKVEITFLQDWVCWRSQSVLVFLVYSGKERKELDERKVYRMDWRADFTKR